MASRAKYQTHLFILAFPQDTHTFMGIEAGKRGGDNATFKLFLQEEKVEIKEELCF